MKDLRDIELEYITGVINFFCGAYSKLGDQIQDLLSNQIDKRLLKTNLIYDYKVEVNIYPKSEKRDTKLDIILEDSEKEILEDHISVFYQRLKADSIKEIKYKL